uniref:MULE transposase domain-containing protein n=1 Tax=Ditylenchus dipsaci TaxID=166011 RepID=A0A915CQ32_9BILA
MAEMKSEKGKVMAVCGNYPMRKDYVSANKLTQYWRCSMEGCHARAQSAFGSLVLNETRAHDLHGGSPATIETRTRLTKAVIESLPADFNIKRIVTNKRKPKGAAEVDKALAVMELSDEFKKTATGEQFLFFDSRAREPGQSVIIIFISMHGRQLLRLYKNWSIDGTFFSCPLYFKQLFTINVFKENSTLPAAYILLQDKSEYTYRRAMTALFSRLPGVEPKTIMSDFELAPTNVLQQCFPLAVINFCLFHLSQNLFSQLGKRGLKSLYDNLETRILLRSFAALAFLPVAEVANGFEEVVAELEAKILDKVWRQRRQES